MASIERRTETWGLVWRSNGAMEGYCEHIIREKGLPVLFRTRREARAYRDEQFGAIREDEGLRRPPYNMKMPKVVRMGIAVVRTENESPLDDEEDGRDGHHGEDVSGAGRDGAGR